MNILTRRFLAWIVLGLFLLPIVFQIVCVMLPNLGSYAVLSTSMEPTIHSGDLIYTYDSNRYAPGDVIAFTQNGETVTHRIIQETATGYQTKGDARTHPDSFVVKQKQIRGEVVASVPLYGYVVQPSFDRSWALYLIFAGLLIVGAAGRQLLAME